MKVSARPSLWFWFFFAFVIHGLAMVPFLVLRYFAASRPVSGGGVEIIAVGGPRLHSAKGFSLAASDSSSPHFDGVPQQAQPAQNVSSQGFGSGSGPGSGTEAGDSVVLAEIKKRIERAKRYPQFARSQGIEGTAEVSFQIQEDGALMSCQLAKSSGSQLLDEEAVATVQRAVPYPFYPSSLQVKVDFRVQSVSE